MTRQPGENVGNDRIEATVQDSSAFVPGLVSVTHRSLSVEQILALCEECELEEIEWGGDVHVPAGDINRALDVGRQTADRGLRVAAYGSYFRIGAPNQSTEDFGRVLETAAALGAPRIRVWAGVQGSAQISEDDRKRVVEKLCILADECAAAQLELCLEYHEGTLTDSIESVAKLLEETPATVRLLWQPSAHYSVGQRIAALRQVLPRLAHVHVYYWQPGYERRALADGWDEWKTYLQLLASGRKTTSLLLEFVKDDQQEQLRADAATLRAWIAKAWKNATAY